MAPINHSNYFKFASIFFSMTTSQFAYATNGKEWLTLYTVHCSLNGLCEFDMQIFWLENQRAVLNT